MESDLVPSHFISQSKSYSQAQSSGIGKGREGVKNSYQMMSLPQPPSRLFRGGFVPSFIQCVFTEHVPGMSLGMGYVVNKIDTSPCPQGAYILVNKLPDLSTGIY